MMQTQPVSQLPAWVSDEVCRYLDHTEAGHSIRHLARQAGCHPSTVMRQVRRIESRRDDPLVDSALLALAADYYTAPGSAVEIGRAPGLQSQQGVDFEQIAAKILRCLAQSGAVLAVAEGMSQAVVVRDSNANNSHKIVVARHHAEIFVLRDWISCATPGRISRYYITAAGRTAAGLMMAAVENHARQRNQSGFLEAQKPFMAAFPSSDRSTRKSRRVRYGQAESPLLTLARLQDRNGDPFLSGELVQAGERLREDFELAQIGDHWGQQQMHFNTAKCGVKDRGEFTGTSAAAKNRATLALNNLGAGLSDIALRCCCHLEGLERAERQLGWSARSGKVVLRIALQQLKSHYDALTVQNDMIG